MTVPLCALQVRLAALKREEDVLQRERETLEAAKLAHIKCGHWPRAFYLLQCVRVLLLACGRPRERPHAERRVLRRRELRRLRDEGESRFRDRALLHQRYRMGNLLGKGGFSDVYLVRAVVRYRIMSFGKWTGDPQRRFSIIDTITSCTS
jgi:tousled-like kinase